jgi:hypothetical protein
MTNAGMNEIANASGGINQLVAQCVPSETASDAAGTEAAATPTHSISASEKTESSVSLQQKFPVSPVRKHASLTPEQLHLDMLHARDALYSKCVEAETYIIDVLLPYCEEVIERYRQPGASKNRIDGKPTVEAYFKSIDLNYNTVRSWIHRRKLQKAMFEQPKKKLTGGKAEKPPHLTQLEAKLLGTASAAHEVVKAVKQGGNVDAAIREFERNAPTPERIEEYVERPVRSDGVTQVEKLAIRICKLIDENDPKHGQTILELARELLKIVEPATVQPIPTGQNKRQQKEAGAKTTTVCSTPSSRSVTRAAADTTRARRYNKNQLTVKKGSVFVIGAPHLGAIAAFEGEDANDQAWKEVERLTTSQSSTVEGTAGVAV